VKRDFAVRIDSLLGSVRASLDSIASYMKNHVSRGDLSDEEFRKYAQFIAKSMGETIKMSRDLYSKFPDIEPDELKNVPDSD
jgi:hypothetical protein